MISMSESARQELEAYFSDKEKEDIRVYLASGGCSGPRLALALDKAGEDDAAYTVSGFTFCVSKELEVMVGSIAVDFADMGFVVTSENPLPHSGGGCGGCCGGCGSQSSCVN